MAFFLTFPQRAPSQQSSDPSKLKTIHSKDRSLSPLYVKPAQSCWVLCMAYVCHSPVPPRHEAPPRVRVAQGACLPGTKQGVRASRSTPHPAAVPCCSICEAHERFGSSLSCVSGLAFIEDGIYPTRYSPRVCAGFGSDKGCFIVM